MPLLLGEAPSAAGDRFRAFPLSGRPAETLCRAAGFERDGSEAWYWTLTRHFETLNAIERHADAYPWSVPRARERWTRWLLSRPEEEQRLPLVVVCVGRRAAGAVGLKDALPWGEWLTLGLLQVAVIPHPSGRNRVLNDPTMRDLMGRVLLEAIERARADNGVDIGGAVSAAVSGGSSGGTGA